VRVRLATVRLNLTAPLTPSRGSVGWPLRPSGVLLCHSSPPTRPWTGVGEETMTNKNEELIRRAVEVRAGGGRCMGRPGDGGGVALRDCRDGQEARAIAGIE